MEENKLHEETTDLLQVTDTYYHIKLYRVHLIVSEKKIRNNSGDKH